MRQEIESYLKSGNLLLAVRHYADFYEVSVREAEKAVAAMSREMAVICRFGHQASDASHDPLTVQARVCQHLSEGDRKSAILLYQQYTQLPLAAVRQEVRRIERELKAVA